MIAELLIRYGWLAAENVTPVLIKAALDAYANWHRTATPEQHLNLPRFCNLPDLMTLGNCKWAQNSLIWAMTGKLPSVTLEEQKAAYQEAWNRWSAVCSITAKEGQNPNVVFGTKRIDGPFGILAESELPCQPNVQQLNQWFDASESFVIGQQGGQSIDLIAVMCHELGHVIGLEHSNDGGLMDPIYKPGVDRPQGQQELAAAKQRYPGPGPGPGPIGPDPKNTGYTLHVTGDLRVDGFRLTRLTK